MNQNANPLKQFFRQPAIYLKLPSGGQFWPQGSLEMPPNNEIPVLPMTAMDEITYRTPDALFNGSAVVNVIQSCCPSIKNAWKVPSVDLNAILVAIRIASYGSDMDVETTCTNCGHKDDFGLNLTSVLDSMPMPNFGSSLQFGDLEIFFKPLDYQKQNEINTLQFEQQKIMQLIPSSDLPEAEKMTALNRAIQEITKLTIKVIKDSIASVRTPQALVSDPAHIEELLNNCDKSLFNSIRDKAIQLRAESELRPLKMTCSECSTTYEQPFSMDATTFFGDAS